MKQSPNGKSKKKTKTAKTARTAQHTEEIRKKNIKRTILSALLFCPSQVPSQSLLSWPSLQSLPSLLSLVSLLSSQIFALSRELLLSFKCYMKPGFKSITKGDTDHGRDAFHDAAAGYPGA